MTRSKFVRPFQSVHLIPADAASLDKSSFRALYFSMIPTEHKEPSLFKLVVVGPEERVVGVHVIGTGSDELLQGFAVAVKMGGEQNLTDQHVVSDFS